MELVDLKLIFLTFINSSDSKKYVCLYRADMWQALAGSLADVAILLRLDVPSGRVSRVSIPPYNTQFLHIIIIMTNHLLYYFSFCDVCICSGGRYKWTEVIEAVGLQQLNLRWDDHLGYRRSWRFEYNLLCLRMISFNMDYYWLVSSSGHANLPGAVKRQHKASCVE